MNENPYKSPEVVDFKEKKTPRYRASHVPRRQETIFELLAGLFLAIFAAILGWGAFSAFLSPLGRFWAIVLFLCAILLGFLTVRGFLKRLFRRNTHR